MEKFSKNYQKVTQKLIYHQSNFWLFLERFSKMTPPRTRPVQAGQNFGPIGILGCLFRCLIGRFPGPWDIRGFRTWFPVTRPNFHAITRVTDFILIRDGDLPLREITRDYLLAENESFFTPIVTCQPIYRNVGFYRTFDYYRTTSKNF